MGVLQRRFTTDRTTGTLSELKENLHPKGDPRVEGIRVGSSGEGFQVGSGSRVPMRINQ